MSNYYSKKQKAKRKHKKTQEKRINRVEYTEEQLAQIQKEKEERAVQLEIERRKKVKKEKRKKTIDSIIKALPLTLCILLILTTIINATVIMIKQCLFKSYDDYSRYSLKYESQLLSKSDDSYYVYIYQETCPSCETIKKDVFQYIERCNEDEDETTPKLYLFEISAKNSIVGETSNLTGVTEYSDLVVSGTPTLLLVVDGKVQSAFENSEKIYNQLKD